MHTGKKLEDLRERLQGTGPPLDSNGQLQPHDAALEHLLAVLDWDGRIELNKAPKTPGDKAIDRIRYGLFNTPVETLKEMAEGMHSPRHTCPAYSMAYYYRSAYYGSTYFADRERAGQPLT